MMRTANLLVDDGGEIDEDGGVPICPWRTLDFFSITSMVLILLLRGVEDDNRAEFYDFLDATAAEQFADDVAPWFAEDEEDQTPPTDDKRSDR